MTPTYLDLADLALASYTEPATIETGDAHVLVKERAGIIFVSPRGTNPKVLRDDLRDLGAAWVRNDDILRRCPSTITADAEQIVWRLLPYLRAKPWAGGAHSKGAGELLLVAAMLTHGGLPPLRIGAFEPLRVGPCGDLLKADTCLLTRHGLDEITEVPPWLGHPLAITPLVWIGPAPTDPLIQYHDLAGVRASIAALGW
jgi:hypothetical protein